MRTRALLSIFIFCLSSFVGSTFLHAQGLPIDSLIGRIVGELRTAGLDSAVVSHELHRTITTNYDDQRVWGLSTGDFTNDTLRDLAISLYDHSLARNEVRVLFFRNDDGSALTPIFDRVIPYIESPIEIGLTIDGSVVTLIQKTGDQHWFQEGYSDECGDLALVDRFETEREEIIEPKTKVRALGHEIYRNFETLLTKESYFTPTTGEMMFQTHYVTLPAYHRLRAVYPGYGQILMDTGTEFVIQGLGLRKDARDLSIANLMSAFDDEYLYVSASVNDDYVINGRPRSEENDRVTLWFDTKFTGDRMNRDRHILTKKGGFPTFRDAADSFLYSLTFALPATPGKVTQIDYSAVAPLSSAQQDALKAVKAQYFRDTANGLVTGYTLKMRIPFAYLGFESNPAKLYERVVPIIVRDTSQQIVGDHQAVEAATIGFTALVTDVDDVAHPNDVTVQATSMFRNGDPSSLGTMILQPARSFYGDVRPTYRQSLRRSLLESGF